MAKGSSSSSKRSLTPSAPTGAGHLLDEQEHGPPPPLSPPAPIKWKMALYVRQPFPDNYVPDTFLDKLVTNAGISRPELLSIFVGAAAITQQISVIVIFLMAFLGVSEGTVPLHLLLATDAGLLIGGYGLAACLFPRKMLCPITLLSTLGWLFLCAASLRVMSPVLRTLTVSFSDDTIYALALTFSALHLVFHDYATKNGPSTTINMDAPPPPTTEDEDVLASPDQFHGTFSLNAALFASVLLASRLESNEQVFGFVLLAIELFAFFPLARHLVRRRSITLHLLVTLGLVGIATASLAMAPERRALLVLYVLLVGFVSLICPVWLQYIHKWKCIIQGPWDVASVESTGEDD